MCRPSELKRLAKLRTAQRLALAKCKLQGLTSEGLLGVDELEAVDAVGKCCDKPVEYKDDMWQDQPTAAVVDSPGTQPVGVSCGQNP